MNKVLITSQGRTATVSLNNYLNKLEGVSSFHERRRQDVPFLFYSQLSEYKELTYQYVLREEQFVGSQQSEHAVIVNPYFRFAGNIFKEEFNWKVAHIVRDPRTYLESLYKRNTFTKHDVLLNQLPKSSDPFASKWNQATRFEKLCWYYSNTLHYFAASNIKWYRFEEITSKPEALHKMLKDLSLPINPTLSLSIENSGVNLKTKLATIKRKGFLATAPVLNWDTLSTKEINTYHELLDSPAKHFGYVL